MKLQEKRNLIKNKLDKRYCDLTLAALNRSQIKCIEDGEKIHLTF